MQVLDSASLSHVVTGVIQSSTHFRSLVQRLLQRLSTTL